MSIYKKNGEGYLFQETITGPLPDYSSNYSKQRYDTYNTNDRMSELRFNVISNVVKQFDTITDFGYGNGAFIKYCKSQDKTVYGYDISDYPVPEGCVKIDNINDVSVDVITFFDSLEHIPENNLQEFLTNLKTKYICISVPWYHEEQGTDWFMNWKHRRENEHIHHFDSIGLVTLLSQSKYKILHLSNCEDEVRTPVDGLPNILTIVAKKI